jgi:hypothetical protein
MKARSYVKISKVAASEDPHTQTPSQDDYESLKGIAPMSLPVEYWIEGYLFKEPTIGKSVVVEREVRNGIKVCGAFVTSAVVKILEDGFETRNSIYKLEVLALPGKTQ